MALRTCTWCGQFFDAPLRPGPVPRYCRPSHRQRAYEARRRDRTGTDPGDGTSPSESGWSSASNGLFVKVLGPVQAYDLQGRPISLGPALRGVLSILALRPREVVSREALIDRVWPGADDRAARRRLHTAVWKLRTLLTGDDEAEGRRLIRWSAPGYLLDFSDDQLDWTRFRRLRLAGERALRHGDNALAKTYLSSALSLWSGREVLAGVDVSPDDLGFVAERLAGREQATRNLIEARFQLGEQVIPELEGVVAADPVDEQAVWQLAVAYYRSGEVTKALALSNRYLKVVADLGGNPSARIGELQRAVLNGRPGTYDLINTTRSDGRPARSVVAHRIFLSATWDYNRTLSMPLPAELHLLVEGFGGAIYEATDGSLDVSFFEATPALAGAIALQDRLGGSVARVGIDVRQDSRVTEIFEGPPRARARLLAAAAREGHILICGGEHLEPGSVPPRTRLRSLGSHRLNAIGPAIEVHQLVSQKYLPTAGDPRWFDQDPVHNLALEPSRFIGRERELAAVTDALAGRRLVTLSGPPGSGKTRLAARVATGLAGDYKDGAWFVALQPLPHGGLVPGTLAEVLRMPRPTSVHLDALTRYLSNRHALLVLDNCEHVLRECREVVDAILAGCPLVSVITTSREALHSDQEEVIPVLPFELPPTGPRQAVLNNEAVRLFLDRMVSPSTDRLDDSVVEAVARICRAVEGIPLALVLAAGRALEIGILPLAEVLEDVIGEGEGINVLTGAPAASESDRATLAGTMEWSYRLLTDREQTVFDSLSVFRSHFWINDAFAIICARGRLTRPDIVAALDRLVQTSLLNADTHPTDAASYRLLQPIRDFASAKLAGRRRMASTLRRRHAEHFLKIAEECEPRIRGPQDRTALTRLDAGLPDMYAAIRWAISNNDSAVALRLVRALWVYWLVRGRGAEAIPMIEAALALDRSISRQRAEALVACCQLSWVGGEFARIRENSREVLAIGEALSDDQTWALGALGLVAINMFDDSDEFIPLRSQEILPVFRRLGDHWYGGQALQTAGGSSWHRGDYDRAEALYLESVIGFRKLGHPTLMNSLRGHALMLALLGRLDEGSSELESALVSAYTEGDIVGVAEALCFKGAIARYGGDHGTARSHYKDALKTARDAAYGWMIFFALNGLGDTEGLGLQVSDERIAASVQLLSFAEAMSLHTGLVLAPREREDHARDLERARSRLGDEAFEAAFARGQHLSLDEAIDLGLSLDVGPAGI